MNQFEGGSILHGPSSSTKTSMSPTPYSTGSPVLAKHPDGVWYEVDVPSSSWERFLLHQVKKESHRFIII
ncbi:hypothetical protein ACVWWD_003861 [Mesorhizobium sp. URHB0026]